MLRRAKNTTGGRGGEEEEEDDRRRECTVYSSHDTGWEPWFEDEGVPTTPATLSFRP